MVTCRTLVFAATYNESFNVRELVGRVFAVLPTCKFLIVDDNSPDGTGDVLDKLAFADDRIIIIRRPSKLGLGSAHRLAMRYAIEAKYDILVTLDANLSHPPEDIPRLLAALDSADCVTGSRYDQGGTSDCNHYRGVRSVLANWAARVMRWTPVPAAATSFRAYRVDRLTAVSMEGVRSSDSSFFLESFYSIRSSGLRCRDVPIHSCGRSGWESHNPRLHALFDTLAFLRLAYRHIFNRRPRENSKQDPEEKCYFCNHRYMVYKSRPSGINTQPVRVECTSMDHHSKPPVAECLVCGLCYVPRTHYIDRHLYNLYEQTRDDTYLEYRAARRRTFLRSYARINSHLPPSGKLLEVGCYCGFFLEIARRNGWNTIGIEPSRWAADYAREALGLDVRAGTLSTNINNCDRDYDVVVAWDVLEHLTDPLAELAKISHVLRDGGLFCFSTLDIDNWFPRLLGKRWPWLMEMHLFYFSRLTMTQMLDAAGFEVIAVEPYCHYISTRYLFMKLRAILLGNTDSCSELIRRLIPERPYIPFFFGDIKLFICKKARKSIAATGSMKWAS